MKNLFLLLLLGWAFSLPAQNLPKASCGTIHHLENFKSQYLASRNIDIWLPDGYSTSKKYAVVYMHDGQMLFDTTQAWNKKEWKVDETLARLNNEHKTIDCIVVGIWNNGADRIAEYFPNKIFDLLGETTQKYMDYGTGESDKGYEATQSFVDFIAKGKGYTDKNYRSKVYDKAQHNEVAWSERLNVPFEFLLIKTVP